MNRRPLIVVRLRHAKSLAARSPVRSSLLMLPILLPICTFRDTNWCQVWLWNGLITFADAAREWLSYVEFDRKRRASTLRDYRHVVDNALVPMFGEVCLEQLTSEMIDAYRVPRAPPPRSAVQQRKWVDARQAELRVAATARARTCRKRKWKAPRRYNDAHGACGYPRDAPEPQPLRPAG